MAAVLSLYESEECCTQAVLSPGGGLILGPLPVEGVGPLVCEEIPINVLVMLFCSIILVDLGRAR